MSKSGRCTASRSRADRGVAARLLLALIISTATSSGVATQQNAPAIRTDSTAYVAGDVVRISGQYFSPGESVTLQVTHADGTAEPGMGHEPSTLTVGADATFVATWTASATDIAGPRFIATVSGSVSGTVEPAAFTRVVVVTMDKGDYQPGDFARIDGRGFAPYELVELQVVHANGDADGNGHEPFFATADDAGAVTATWYVDPDDSLGSKFIITATGDSSNVVGTATFWDAGAVSLTSLNTAYTEDFTTLANTGNDNTILPNGWDLNETGGGTRDNERYAAGTGSDNTGDTYSFGASSSTERAFGGLLSGTLNPTIGAQFTNNTVATITTLSISYVGEMWRAGVTNRNAADRLDFQYSTNATSLTTGTWVDVDALDFSSPNINTTLGPLDGNASGNRTPRSFTITGLSIGVGATFWIRWNDFNISGSDDGLAIDDFSMVPQPYLTINDVSLNEGNSGTTSFTFTVSLSAPAGAGGVTFDIATADGTAQDDNPAAEDNDYNAKSLTGQTIPAGSSTYTFDVLVNGDTAPEANQAFFVDVSNVTGATVTDGQGRGTIVNDDAAPNLTVSDVTASEGNAGTTTLTFTVSLSLPAGTGGVTFDIATADGTAQDDDPVTEDNDYAASALTGQAIPAGNSTYTFAVLVNGDTIAESNETFFVNVTNATNAIVTDDQGQGLIVNEDVTFIHDVQGSGTATPIPALSTVIVEGVVTASFQGLPKLQGFFLQEENTDADVNSATSEGIFVFCNSCQTAVVEGQRVKVTGTVSEFFGMTEITASTAGSVEVTNAGNNLALVMPTPIDLPIVGNVNAFYETLEGMKVTFVDPLTVSEYFELGRFGQIVLYEGGRPRQFTEANAPSVAGNNAHLDNLSRREVILDDDNNTQQSFLATSSPAGPADGFQSVYYPRANGGFSTGTQGTDFFRGGDLVNGLTGVLHWSFPGSGANTWRIRPTSANPAAFTVANPRPATPPAVGGAIKAVGMNLLNYFTTLDTTASTSEGPCAPSQTLDCRGADSTAELNRQRARAAKVVCTLNADVFAFMELENTTASATITDLLGAINASCGGTHPYQFVNTGGTLGTDAIRVQLIFRSGILSPVGAPISDLDAVHNRPPTAQTFDVVGASNPAFGQRFTMIANHFKSKGCPGTGLDADLGDGQGCFNATRVAQANRLLSWINTTVLPGAGDPDVLLLGDFNSYAKEDPITTLEVGGFSDLETVFHGENAYSYLFDGQLGHLDYGFASTSLLAQVTGADAWHINADEVDLFDYNDEIRDGPGEAQFEEKPDGSALVPPRVVFAPDSVYRASDHDPVVVGLFPIADLSISKTDSPDPVIVGQTLTYSLAVTNNGPNDATGVTVTDPLPAGAAFVSASEACAENAGTVTCSIGALANGASVPLTITVTAPATVGPISNTVSVAGSQGDSNSANNSATATTHVIFPFSGFFQPVDNLPVTNSVNAGRAVPVKFSLGGNQGLNVLAPGYPKSEVIACSSSDAVDGIEETVTAGGSSLSFDPATGHYDYVWKTDKAWAGTCRQLVMKFVDGTIQRANFQFVK